MKLKKFLYVVLIILAVIAAIAGAVYVIDSLLKKKELIKKEYLPCEITAVEAEQFTRR